MYKKVLIFFLVTISLVSCQYEIECSDFRYSKFNIDSTQLVSDLLVEDSLNNSYELKFVKTERIDEKGANTFSNFQHCRNGWKNYYTLNGCKLSLSYYLQDDSIYFCQIDSEDFSDKIKFNSIEDLQKSFQVSNSCFDKIYIKEGLIYEIIDINGNKFSRKSNT